MINLAKRLNKIVEEFIGKNVPNEMKHDFVIAAIHFNINLNDCSKYDLMRIDHKAKDLANAEENEVLTTSAIYSYILFRAIQRNEIELEDKVTVELALMGISNAITEYLTYRIDEKMLNIKLYNELSILGI